MSITNHQRAALIEKYGSKYITWKTTETLSIECYISEENEVVLRLEELGYVSLRRKYVNDRVTVTGTKDE